jgi:ABC-type multidrug transport system permease subunit
MIINEIKKNIQLLFRNWATFLFLVIGPLVLIAIVGVTFGDDQPNNLSFGVYEVDGSSQQLPFLRVFGNTVPYYDLEDCKRDLSRGRIHLCLEIYRGLESSDQLEVTFYYDLSRKTLSTVLLAKAKENLGKRSEDISLENTRSLLSQVQELVGVLQQGQYDLERMGSDLEITKSNLITRRAGLNDLKLKVQNYKNQVTIINNDVLNLKFASNSITSQSTISFDEIVNNMNDIENVAKSLQTDPSFSAEGTKSYNIYGQNLYAYKDLSSESYNIYTQADKALLIMAYATKREVSTKLNEIKSDINDINNKINAAAILTNNAVNEIQVMESLIDAEILNNEQAIIKVEEAIIKLDDMKNKIHKHISSFKSANPELAENLVKPVLENYSSLAYFDNVQIVFPSMLIMIMLFITILFSTILSSSEINGPAYFRNLISPRAKIGFPFGILVTTIILVMFQLGVLFIISETMLGVHVFNHFIPAILLTTLLVTLFALIGMSVTFLFKNSQTSILASIFIALGMYMFSNLVRPLEVMPEFVGFLAQFNPLVIGHELYRLLFSYGILFNRGQIFLLFVYLGVMFIIWSSAHRRFVRKLQ